MSDSVRFVHAADLHLGAPFKRVKAADPRVRDALLSAGADALDRIVDLCVREDVDFLVLAGDVFDSGTPHPAAQHAFRKAMIRLDSADIPVYLVRGNHDPADGSYDWADPPENVHVFSSDDVEEVHHERPGRVSCTLSGWSFPQRAVLENVASRFSAAARGGISIGVLHANLGNREGWDPYAPCSVEDLRATGIEYWALGHVHLPEVVSEEGPTIVYAGSPQGLDPGENGPRGCYLVEAGVGWARPEFVETAGVRWEHRDVDLSEALEVDDVRRALEAACSEVRAVAASNVVLRVAFTGRTAVHHSIRSQDLDALCNDVNAENIEMSTWVWIDRVTDRTRPLVDMAGLRQDQGFIGDFIRDADELSASPTAAEFVEEALAALLAKVPADVRPDEDPARLIESARDDALDLLIRDGE